MKCSDEKCELLAVRGSLFCIKHLMSACPDCENASPLAHVGSGTFECLACGWRIYT